MEVEKQVTVRDCIGAHDLTITARDPEFEMDYSIRWGCQVIYLTEKDVKNIKAMLNRALREGKKLGGS